MTTEGVYSECHLHIASTPPSARKVPHQRVLCVCTVSCGVWEVPLRVRTPTSAQVLFVHSVADSGLSV